jgi:hypothetical protein
MKKFSNPNLLIDFFFLMSIETQQKNKNIGIGSEFDSSSVSKLALQRGEQLHRIRLFGPSH